MSHVDIPSEALAGSDVPDFSIYNTRWVRASQLPGMLCSWDLAYRCVRSGWLKPIIQGKRRTIYKLADVLNCMRRIEAGELPPTRSKLRK